MAHGPVDGLATAKALDLLWFCDVLVLTSAIPVRKIHAFSTQGFFSAPRDPIALRARQEEENEDDSPAEPHGPNPTWSTMRSRAPRFYLPAQVPGLVLI
jgi:hypothetical protein